MKPRVHPYVASPEASAFIVGLHVHVNFFLTDTGTGWNRIVGTLKKSTDTMLFR